MTENEHTTDDLEHEETPAGTLLRELYELTGGVMDAIEGLAPDNIDSTRTIALALLWAVNERAENLGPFILEAEAVSSTPAPRSNAQAETDADVRGAVAEVDAIDDLDRDPEYASWGEVVNAASDLVDLAQRELETIDADNWRARRVTADTALATAQDRLCDLIKLAAAADAGTPIPRFAKAAAEPVV